jgi:urease accessory protein
LPDSSLAPRELTTRANAEAPPSRLELSFAPGPDGGTQLVHQFAGYPFHLCRPFRLDGDPAAMLTLYVQSCSGGIYEGDRLSTFVEVDEGASAHVTTQAACIAYGMREAGARHHAALEAAAGSLLEYVPDPVILFPKARLDARLLVRAEPGSRVVAVEAFLLHDPLGQARPFARLASLLQIEDRGNGRVLFRDRIDIAGDAWIGRNPGVTGVAAGMATLIVLDSDAAALSERLRARLASVPDVWAGASLLPEGAGAVGRILALDGRALRAGIAAAWCAARLHWTGAEPPHRRK